METYTTSQECIKLYIEYSHRADGVRYTFDERSRKVKANVKYEDFSAKDFIGGKCIYNELIALRESQEFITDRKQHIILAHIYYVDIARNKEFLVCTYNSRTKFSNLCDFKLKRDGEKIFLEWDKVLRIDERRVQKLIVKSRSVSVRQELLKSIPKH